MGLGGAIIWIPAPAIGARVFPPERAGIAVGLAESGIGLGIVFAGNCIMARANSRGGRRLAARLQIEFSIAVVVLAGTLLVLKSRAATRSSRRVRRIRRTSNGSSVVPTTVAYTAYGFAYILVIAFLVALERRFRILTL